MNFSSSFNNLLFYILLIFALSIVIQFQRGRRINLNLAKSVMEKIRTTFKGFEREYQWIGGLSGFQAILSKGSVKISILFLMLPRHSLLYLPISKVLKGGDWLSIRFEFKKKEKFSKDIFVISVPDIELRRLEEKGDELYLFIVIKRPKIELIDKVFDHISKFVLK